MKKGTDGSGLYMYISRAKQPFKIVKYNHFKTTKDHTKHKRFFLFMSDKKLRYVGIWNDIKNNISIGLIVLTLVLKRQEWDLFCDLEKDY